MPQLDALLLQQPELQLEVPFEMSAALQLSSTTLVPQQSLQLEGEIQSTWQHDTPHSLNSEEDFLDLLQLQQGLQEAQLTLQTQATSTNLSPLSPTAESVTARELQQATHSAATLPATSLPLVLITAKTNYACLNVALALIKSGLKPGEFQLVVSNMYFHAHIKAYAGPVKHHMTSPLLLVTTMSKGELPPLKVCRVVFLVASRRGF